MAQRQLLNNPYQRNYPRVLFLCSAGMLRSATAAHIMAGHGWNTRCAGTESYAIQPVCDEVLDWAQEIYCMEQEHANKVDRGYSDKIKVLGIQDIYAYRDPDLIKLIEEKLL